MILNCIVITSPPQSVTVRLNKERVNFTCEGTGDALRWRVAALSPNNPLNQERGITVTDISTVAGNLSSVLTIAVLPINDGVVIACSLYSNSNPFDPADESQYTNYKRLSDSISYNYFVFLYYRNITS